MPARAPKVLFFSPYASWEYHTALEATWAHGLRLRGAEVRTVLCDGLSRACDVYREGINPRTDRSCLSCQARTAAQLCGYATPYEWLGTYLPRDVRHGAEPWAAALPRDELLGAEWNGMAVGAWAASSAHGQFRAAELRLEEPAVEAAVRDLLAGTVRMAAATEVLLDEYRPDTLVLLNGRFFGHWAAVELARRRGLRFVAHERGLRADTVRFAEGRRIHELAALRELWERWRDVPLDRAEIEEVTGILDERRRGENHSRLSFSPPAQEPEQVRAALGLDGRPVCAVFNSSDDEVAAFPERRAGAFPDAADFLPAVLDLAAATPELQFVIRIHPNIQKEKAGTNRDALHHALEIRNRAPANTRVVLPREPFSSYTLVDLAQVGIVYSSTIGLEMAAAGKPVLCAAQATYSHAGCVQPIEAPEQLGPGLQAALAQGASAATARRALRWAYRYFRECCIPFPLVHEEPIDHANLTYSSLDALAEGRDPTLDRICRYLLGQAPSVLPGPTAAERGRSPEEEARLVEAWFREVARRGRGPAAAPA